MRRTLLNLAKTRRPPAGKPGRAARPKLSTRAAAGRASSSPKVDPAWPSEPKDQAREAFMAVPPEPAHPGLLAQATGSHGSGPRHTSRPRSGHWPTTSRPRSRPLTAILRTGARPQNLCPQSISGTSSRRKVRPRLPSPGGRTSARVPCWPRFLGGAKGWCALARPRAALQAQTTLLSEVPGARKWTGTRR